MVGFCYFKAVLTSWVQVMVLYQFDWLSTKFVELLAHYCRHGPTIRFIVFVVDTLIGVAMGVARWDSTFQTEILINLVLILRDLTCPCLILSLIK